MTAEMAVVEATPGGLQKTQKKQYAVGEKVVEAQAVKHLDEEHLLVPCLVTKENAKRAKTPPGAPPPVPSGPEVADVARKLGIDLVFDNDLLYIAEDLIVSELPEGWERHWDESKKAYYHNAKANTTQWAHPLETYYRGLVFMRKEGDQLLEEKAQLNPPTPEECREMAKYFGINPREEVYLMPIAKAAVNAPLPPEWEEYEDDDGEVYFVSKITKKTSEQHPLDGYFFELINQKRFELQDFQAPVYPMTDFHLLDNSFVPYPWMEFVNTATGVPFWYNFRDNLTTYRHPSELIKDVIITEATLRLQSYYRGKRVREANRRLVENLAATSIQKIYRGFHTRRLAKEARLAIEIRALTKIQSVWRGRQQREANKLAKRHLSASIIQSHWRASRSREQTKLLNYVTLAIPLGLHLQAAAVARDRAGAPESGSLASMDMALVRELDELCTRLKTKPEPLLDNMDRRLTASKEEEAALKKPRGPGSVMSAMSMSSKASKASKASKMSRASKASKASKASRASAKKKSG